MEMSTKNISWGLRWPVLGLTILPHSCADCVEIWEPQTPGDLRVCPGLYRYYFNFTMKNESMKLKKINDVEPTTF
jgi:hypothetical protein